MADLLHYEDYRIGQVLDLGSYAVSADEIKAFAAEFDPQPFHMDEEAAKASILGGLCASGWHSCAMLMRMIVNSYLGNSAGMGSNGLEEVKWLRPVFAGETLSGKATILSVRRSAKCAEMGIVQIHWEVFNQEGEQKLDVTGINFMRVRQT